MEQKLGREIEKKKKTISNGQRQRTVSEILNQGIILTMKDDIAYLKGEKESVSMQRGEIEEKRFINMIKAKAGEAARIEEQKRNKKREEIEKRERVLEKESKDIEEIKTKAKQKEMEVIAKKQKELAEERKREIEKEREEQERKMERSKAEEEKIIQDIKKRAVEEGEERKSRLADRKTLEEKLKREKTEVEEKLKELLINRAPLESKKAKLNDNRNMLKDVLKDILKDEVELENRKRSIEQKEAEVTDPAEKHKVEKERWTIEKKIKEVEQQKWKQLEDIKKIKKQIEDIEIKLEGFAQEENRLREVEKKTINLQEKIKLEKEKEKIKKEIGLCHLQLAPLISQKMEIETKNKQREKELQDILAQEAEIERKIKVFRDKKQGAGDIEGEKEIGEEIWKMEQKRQIIEKNRWEKQKEANKSMDGMKEIDLSYRKIFAEKEKLETIIIEINNLLKNASLPADNIEKTKIQEETKTEEAKIKETEQKPVSTEKEEKSELEQEQENIISEIKEKLIAEEKAKKVEEFSNKLKDQNKEVASEEKEGEEEEEQDRIEKRRQEIKKEKEIEIEKQRIMAKKKILKGLEKISPDEEKEREKFLNRIKDKQKEAAKQGFSQGGKIFTLEKPEEEIIYRPLPKTQSSQEKILMRILIFLLLISVVIAIYLLKSKYL